MQTPQSLQNSAMVPRFIMLGIYYFNIYTDIKIVFLLLISKYSFGQDAVINGRSRFYRALIKYNYYDYNNNFFSPFLKLVSQLSGFYRSLGVVFLLLLFLNPETDHQSKTGCFFSLGISAADTPQKSQKSLGMGMGMDVCRPVLFITIYFNLI